MDLSVLLEKLKGLFTPSFLISSVTPLFCFILFNGAILGQYNHTVRKWVSDYYLSSSASKAVSGAILSILLLVIAYVFSTLNLFLLEILQGKHLPKWLEYSLRTGENARLDALTEQWQNARQLRRQLGPNADTWRRELQVARDQGSKLSECNYGVDNNVYKSVEGLVQLRNAGAAIQADVLRDCITRLANVLETNSANLANNPDSIRLDRHHLLLFRLIGYAVGKAEDEYLRRFNDKEFNFSRYTVAPTRIGNAAEAVRGYALSRYGMNLDFFWPRLQKAVQARSDFYKTLQDAKTQLDFTVSLFWLTVASIALWIVLLPFLSRTWLPLISVGLIGPALAFMWYRMAAQNYRSFGDLLRSCIDLFRLELLTDLKVPFPQDSQVEVQLWDRVNRWISYGEGNIFVAYKTD